jgi:hypothetical protein
MDGPDGKSKVGMNKQSAALQGGSKKIAFSRTDKASLTIYTHCTFLIKTKKYFLAF